MTGNAQICTNIVKKRPKWTENSQNLHLMNRFDFRSKTQIFDYCISPPVYKPTRLKSTSKTCTIVYKPRAYTQEFMLLSGGRKKHHHYNPITLPRPLSPPPPHCFWILPSFPSVQYSKV